MKFLPDVVARKGARHLLKLEKASPTLLFGVGVAGMIGSTVLSCRATLKLEEVLEEAQNDLGVAKSLQHREYTEEDRQKDTTIIYTRTALRVAKLYGPGVALGVASIGCLAKSHNILSQRNAALSAAYIAVDKGFKEYRARVVEHYGEEKDREFRYGSEKQQIRDEETGRNKTVIRVSTDEPSVYARFFDQLCGPWSKEPEYNLLFLRCQQNYANDLLRARGHLFLNEVYTMLDIPHSKAGAVVGWTLHGEGDNHVDFGIFTGENQQLRDFVNGREGAVLLDFNVDGLIYDLIEDQDAISWQH